MRQGRDNDILVLDGKLIGINLGADYCAEHEWGIAGIQADFGMDKSKLGLEGRKVSSCSPELIWLEKHKLSTRDKTPWAGIYFGYVHSSGELSSIGSAYGDQNLVTAWSEKDFAAISSDAGKVASLKEVFQAFKDLDIAIWRGGGGVFKNAGLCLAIASRLPKNITDAWYQADDDRNKLKAEVEATGIEALLKKAGCGYFALSPSREKDGTIRFWLNPMEQKRNNYGWYTLEDLKEWAQGKGRIPIKR